jgi:hypothetical protein
MRNLYKECSHRQSVGLFYIKPTGLKLSALMILLASTTWIYSSLQVNAAPEQQLLPSSLSKPIGIKITSPIRDQQVPVGNNLTVSGMSKYNATSNCQVFVILDGIKPYQKAVGLSGADYSNWKYTLSPTYPANIKEGTNKITAKLLCQASPIDLTKFYSINVTGVNQTVPTLVSNNNATAAPSILPVSSNSSLLDPLSDPATTNSVAAASSSSNNDNNDENHHHSNSNSGNGHHQQHATDSNDNNSGKSTNEADHAPAVSGSASSSTDNNIINPNEIAQKIINQVKQKLEGHSIRLP